MTTTIDLSTLISFLQAERAKGLGYPYPGKKICKMKSYTICTDDFARHLAHNGNLSIKATMGIASFREVRQITGHAEEAEMYPL